MIVNKKYRCEHGDQIDLLISNFLRLTNRLLKHVKAPLRSCHGQVDISQEKASGRSGELFPTEDQRLGW